MDREAQGGKDIELKEDINDKAVRGNDGHRGGSVLDRLIGFCLENKVVVFLLVIIALGWGLMVAPFDWDLGGLPRNPVPVDAIPDIGENQQIVFTEWPGRSPQDIEDQVSYPLTVSLLGIPGVRTVRSFSMFGFSSVYVIFDEEVEFYWSRSRILEKLASLPVNLLPDGVRPRLGPDATALGQVFWYTLEGHDEEGRPTGGWDLHELRSIQDWHVRYALMAAEGVSEVASVGGYVREYQVDVDPDAMRAYGVTLGDVYRAVNRSNADVGAGTIEVNSVEYVVRGVGFVKQLSDLETAVVKAEEGVPVQVKDVARVTLGPALRRGALDKEGAEVVGGVAVVRYGENPLAAIRNVKRVIEEITPGLPKKILADGTVSQVRIVPFYDRTGLIYETLGTLNTALTDEILVTVIVVLVMVLHLGSSLLIAGLLPLAVLVCFIAMRGFGVDANIVALSGIAIAIGTMVDMGIVISENILRHLRIAPPGADRLYVVRRATSEVSGAVVTAVATTIVSFLPVFTMEAAEGKLFRPLAFTKTFALIAAAGIALFIIPPMAHLLFGRQGKGGAKEGRGRDDSRMGGRTTVFFKAHNPFQWIVLMTVVLVGFILAFTVSWWAGLIVILVGLYRLFSPLLPDKVRRQWIPLGLIAIAAVSVLVLLSGHWIPLGPEAGTVRNLLFAGLLIGGLLLFFWFFQQLYPSILRWCLDHKMLFLSLPLVIVLLGGMIWLGFESVFGWLPGPLKLWKPVTAVAHAFPGLGKEFMPPLDEGSYLLMPTTMPHASIGEALDVVQKQDMAIRTIPEVETVVGKIGRVDSPLDPAPVSMIETVITYHPEYIQDRNGRRLTFSFDSSGEDLARARDGTLHFALDGEPYSVRGRFERDDTGQLVPDPDGRPFRLWRPPLDPAINDDRQAWDGIREPDHIWEAIVDAAEIPGTTSAPRLQPIAARIVMLQSGMRAPMGVKIKGPDLESIERTALDLERLIKEVPVIEPAMVIADRIVGKPYLEIRIDREAIARYGLAVRDVQDVIEIAVGGKGITSTVEGRERYPVRVRYMRELRDSIEALGKILVPTPGGAQIPLEPLAHIEYERGPQMIKSEDTFLVGYVLMDKKAGVAEVDAVEQVRAYLAGKLENGELELPAGVSYTFAGSYENQVRASKKLMVILPLALIIIFLILYFQFRSVVTSTLVFSGIAVAWAGGFIMIWLYGQPWFLDFNLLGANMRELFQVQPINLSVAIWVGFLALFGIATDDGVVMATYLDQEFSRKRPSDRGAIRRATLTAGSRRVRPCLMTTATTVLALLPVLSSTGRGSDIMVPMAIPSFGGMLLAVISMFVVPVLYAGVKEKWGQSPL